MKLQIKCQVECQSICQLGSARMQEYLSMIVNVYVNVRYMSDRMLEYVSDKMPEYVSDIVSDKMPDAR